MGDKIEILPISGRKQSFVANRTALEFVSENSSRGQALSIKKLPSLRSDYFHLKLTLAKQLNNKGQKKERFILSSENGRPFWHNGSLVFSKVVTIGDEVEIGYNKIRFLPSDQFKIETDFPSINPKLLKSNLPVLLEGKTGTGKTSLAKYIHEQSEREGNFIHLNLSALSENLLESEIFGHIRGAFTGAINDKKGAIIRAHKGTLFLDEIDSVSIAVQIKLLLFLDNYSFTPVGGSTQAKVDCRIIFASGSDLWEGVKRGKIREDFYYRVGAGQKFRLSALEESPEKILKFCERYEQEHFIVIEDRLKELYLKLKWRGNYRQLLGHLEQKKITASGNKLVFDSLDEALILEESPGDLELHNEGILSLTEVRDNHCVRAYFKCQKNMELTAKCLKISPNSLRAVLKKKKIK